MHHEKHRGKEKIILYFLQNYPGTSRDFQIPTSEKTLVNLQLVQAKLETHQLCPVIRGGRVKENKQIFLFRFAIKPTTYWKCAMSQGIRSMPCCLYPNSCAARSNIIAKYGWLRNFLCTTNLSTFSPVPTSTGMCPDGTKRFFPIPFFFC